MAKQAPAPVALDALPVLPLRDVVVYPHMVIPLFVGRDKSMRALERAMEGERQILLVAQTSPDIDDPEVADLHQVGTLAGVLQLLKLPDGTVKVLVEGQSRVAIEDFKEVDGCNVSLVCPTTGCRGEDVNRTTEFQSLVP